MADGKNCKCAAHDKSECACDADWTPQELIDARAEIARLRLTDAERYSVMAGLRSLERELYSDPENLGGEYRDMQRWAATLRGLLARMSGSPPLSDAGQSPIHDKQ